MGTVPAFSSGMALRAGGIALCNFGTRFATFLEEPFASEGTAFLELTFQRNLDHLRFKKPPPEEAQSYNVLQRLSYLAVVFFFFPLMFWTGMAMSPSVTSVFPFFVTMLGGQETARTIHFFAANLLVLFLLVHVFMVCLAGFTQRMRAMITGRVGGTASRQGG
jgi:cytochrome b subunit of formate dehydrogenase